MRFLPARRISLTLGEMDRAAGRVATSNPAIDANICLAANKTRPLIIEDVEMV